MSSGIDWSQMPNPKRRRDRVEGRESWYPFYPGFSTEFASWIIDRFSDVSSVVLDPWNGSGTTTAIAAERGIHAIGVDLNPAMVVVAKARLLDPLDCDCVRPLCGQILKLASGRRRQGVSENEPLASIFAHEGAPAVRGIERSIRLLLVDGESDSGDQVLDASRISPLAGFFYLALFRVCRAIMRECGTTNPVWTRLRMSGREMPRPSWMRVRDAFLREVERLLSSESNGRPALRAELGTVAICVADAARLPLSGGSVQLTVSSPPYCTRVDYAVATLPELAILGMKRDFGFENLRRNLTGTTTVPSACDVIESDWGSTCRAFLRAVENHRSKASSGYYLKNHARYFRDLFRAIKELYRTSASGGRVVLVVQDSYYKDVYNDLAKITVEMAEGVGFSHLRTCEFPLMRLIAASNPKVRRYRMNRVTATESVVVLLRN